MTKKKITCKLINVASSNTLTHLRPNSLKVVYTLIADKVCCGLKKSHKTFQIPCVSFTTEIDCARWKTVLFFTQTLQSRDCNTMKPSCFCFRLSHHQNFVPAHAQFNSKRIFFIICCCMFIIFFAHWCKQEDVFSQATNKCSVLYISSTRNKIWPSVHSTDGGCILYIRECVCLLFVRWCPGPLHQEEPQRRLPQSLPWPLLSAWGQRVSQQDQSNRPLLAAESCAKNNSAEVTVCLTECRALTRSVVQRSGPR